MYEAEGLSMENSLASYFFIEINHTQYDFCEEIIYSIKCELCLTDASIGMVDSRPRFGA
jgi:hypothetical protein